MPQTKIVPKHPQVNNITHLWEFVTLKSPSPLQTKKQKFISTEPNNFSNPISDSSVTSPSSFLASAFGFPQLKALFFFFFFLWGQRSEGKKNGKTFPCKDLVRNFDGQLVDTSKCDCYKMMKWAKIYNARAWLEILISWKSLFEIDLFDIQISIKLIGNEWIRMILFPSKYLSSNKNEENSITLFCIYTSYGKQDVYTKWNSPQSYSPCKADKHDL